MIENVREEPAMSDIVERVGREAAMLREIAQSQARGIDWQANLTASSTALTEAADTITRLRAELAVARAKAFEEAAKALDSRASIYEEKKAKADPFAPDDCNRHERMVHTMEAMEIAAQAIRAMIEKDTTP